MASVDSRILSVLRTSLPPPVAVAVDMKCAVSETDPLDLSAVGSDTMWLRTSIDFLVVLLVLVGDNEATTMP